MRRVIRSYTFETNSSSVHSLTVRSDTGKWKDVRIDSPPIIKVYPGEYGWGYDELRTFGEKLAYAIVMILCTGYEGKCGREFGYGGDEFVMDQSILEECEGYQTLLTAINKHTNCEAIVIKRNDQSMYPYGYIDHQSCCYANLQEFLDDWNVDAERYLFDNSVKVIIDNDNH